MIESILLIALVIAVVIALTAYLGKKRTRTEQRPPLPVRFTQHSRERMAARKVRQSDIEQVLTAPQRAVRDESSGSVRLERDYPGRVLEVWVVAPWPATTEIVVKTTAWNYIEEITIPIGAAAHVIGKNGACVRRISDQTSAWISVNGDSVRVEGRDARTVAAAKNEIEEIVRSFEARV